MRSYMIIPHKVGYNRPRVCFNSFIINVRICTNWPSNPTIYDEFRSARPRLSHWMERYQDAVLAGELTAAESVRDYLALLAAAESVRDCLALLAADER
jgi:hypothetical protein